MKKHIRLLLILAMVLVLCIAVSWMAIFLLETTAVVPFGLCPVLVLAGGASSVGGLIGCVAVVVLLYVLMFVCLWGVSRRRRFGTVGLVILLVLDLSANVIFTVTTWWYLLAVLLDLVILALSYGLYRLAGLEE